jgi:hypothetical protein
MFSFVQFYASIRKVMMTFFQERRYLFNSLKKEYISMLQIIKTKSHIINPIFEK